MIKAGDLSVTGRPGTETDIVAIGDEAPIDVAADECVAIAVAPVVSAVASMAPSPRLGGSALLAAPPGALRGSSPRPAYTTKAQTLVMEIGRAKAGHIGIEHAAAIEILAEIERLATAAEAKFDKTQGYGDAVAAITTWSDLADARHIYFSGTTDGRFQLTEADILDRAVRIAGRVPRRDAAGSPIPVDDEWLLDSLTIDLASKAANIGLDGYLSLARAQTIGREESGHRLQRIDELMTMAADTLAAMTRRGKRMHADRVFLPPTDPKMAWLTPANLLIYRLKYEKRRDEPANLLWEAAQHFGSQNPAKAARYALAAAVFLQNPNTFENTAEYLYKADRTADARSAMAHAASLWLGIVRKRHSVDALMNAVEAYLLSDTAPSTLEIGKQIRAELVFFREAPDVFLQDRLGPTVNGQAAQLMIDRTLWHDRGLPAHADDVPEGPFPKIAQGLLTETCGDADAILGRGDIDAIGRMAAHLEDVVDHTQSLARYSSMAMDLWCLHILAHRYKDIFGTDGVALINAYLEHGAEACRADKDDDIPALQLFFGYWVLNCMPDDGSEDAGDIIDMLNEARQTVSQEVMRRKDRILRGEV